MFTQRNSFKIWLFCRLGIYYYLTALISTATSSHRSPAFAVRGGLTSHEELSKEFDEAGNLIKNSLKSGRGSDGIYTISYFRKDVLLQERQIILKELTA